MMIELNNDLFSEEHLSRLSEIECRYGFEKYELIKSIIKLFKDVNLYKNNINNKKRQRISSSKKELKAILKQAQKLNRLFNLSSITTQLVFLDYKQWEAANSLQNSLKNFCDFTPSIINNLQDKGGRPNDSIPEFLICQLLYILKHHANCKWKIGWDDINGCGKGNTYEFLREINDIFESINPCLRLGTEKSICNIAIALIAEHKKSDFSYLSALLSQHQ